MWIVRVALGLVLLVIPNLVAPQGLAWERSFYQDIVKSLEKDLREHYYDPTFRGVDLAGSAKTTKDRIKEAKTIEEMADLIARFLYEFDDSHLTFFPPPRSVQVDYGWELRMIGDKAFVIGLSEDSDAFKKGIRPGDHVHMIEGYILNRKEFPIVRHYFNVLRPYRQLIIVITKPSGNSYKVAINAKITETGVFAPTNRQIGLDRETRYDELTTQLFSREIPGLCIWKMPAFAMSEIQTGKMLDKARECQALILDLRGNAGGSHSSLVNLLGGFINKETEIGEIRRRGRKEKFFVAPVSRKPFRGELAVLIDSGSTSAAEIFARVIQFEKLGVLVGDQSGGAVMQATSFRHAYGMNPIVPYSVQVTIADLIMKDGRRLEKIGVAPDHRVLPAPLDLVNGRDPTMARAAEVLGFTLTPAAAGAIFAKRRK